MQSYSGQLLKEENEKANTNAQDEKGINFTQEEVESNGEKNKNTVEKLESSNVTIVTSDVTLVTIVKLESSNVTLISEDKSIIGAHTLVAAGTKPDFKSMVKMRKE